MKKFFFVLIVFSLVLTSANFAQDEVRPNFVYGKTAMLFEFDGLNTLRANAFNGGIGAKMFFGPALAIRAGLQFASFSDENPDNPGVGQPAFDEESSYTTFGLTAGVEYHIRAGRVSPYVGAEVSFSTTSTEIKNPGNNAGTIEGAAVNNVAGGTQIGVGVLAGAEFFLFRELSLSAEYQLGFVSQSNADVKTTQGTITQTTKGGSTSIIGIQSQGTFTLAFYF